MSSAEQQAALLSHPIAAADVSGVRGVYRYALGSTVNITLPQGLRGAYVRISVMGDDPVQYACGIGAAPVLSNNATSAVGTGSAAAGASILGNSSMDAIIPREATHLTIIGGTGFVELYRSETSG